MAIYPLMMEEVTRMSHEAVTVCHHPLIQHKLASIRDLHTSVQDFRQAVNEVAMLMTYEVTKDLPTEQKIVKTPVAEASCEMLQGPSVGLIPILRAGIGFLDGVLKVIPDAVVGHIGLKRNEQTLQPEQYYFNLPTLASERTLIVMDPMLATGGSAIAAIELLKQAGCSRIKLMCLIAAPEGVQAVQQAHPDVPIYVAALDEKLNENGYIVPGLGDAGDRIFGTE
jgi:uracil phosphoribosyltransferase